MGHLIPTEVDNSGHIFTFKYSILEEKITCFMNCTCGWFTEIKSFEHSWSVIEAKVIAKKHLDNYVIPLQSPIAFFTFENYSPQSI